MIKQECIGFPDMILLLMNFFVSKKIKIKAEIVLSPGGAYFHNKICEVAVNGAMQGKRTAVHGGWLDWPLTAICTALSM